MPTVPSAVAPSVTPSANTGIGYQSAAGATSDAFGGSIGEAQSKLGATIGSVADQMATHAEKMQADVNAAAAKNLFLEGDVAIGKLTIDYNLLEGANRVNAYPKYVEAIGTLRKDMLARAPNDAVAKAFDQDFARRVGYSIVDGARGAASAQKQYNREASKAVQANSLDHIAAQAKDDQRFETELAIGRKAYMDDDEYKGSSPEVKAQRDQAYTDAAWSTRLQSLAKSDPLRARTLLEKAPVGGLAKQQLQDTITQGIINVQSRVDSDSIVDSGALVSDGLKAWIKKSEGYADKAVWDHKQFSSGYGTKAQPGDENLTPEQRKVVYEQRLNTELARAANTVDTFMPGLPKGKREALIDLTFNAGSGWTSAGLGQAVKSGDDARAQEIFAQYSRASGQPNAGLQNRRIAGLDRWNSDKTPTDPADAEALTSGKALERAKEMAKLRFPNDPANEAKYLDTLQSRISSDMRVMTKEARDLQNGLKLTVQAELFSPDNSITSYDQLSPKAQQAFDAAPPALQDIFTKRMRKNSEADVSRTPERAEVWDSLYGMAMRDPQAFRALNVDNLDMTRADKSRALAMQAKIDKTTAEGAKIAPAMSAMDPFLKAANIQYDKNNFGKYDKFQGVFAQELNKYVEENKRQPTVEEQQKIGQRLLKDVVVGKGWFGGDKTAPAYQVAADKTPIPLQGTTDAEKAAFVNSLPKGAVVIVDGKRFTKS